MDAGRAAAWPARVEDAIEGAEDEDGGCELLLLLLVNVSLGRWSGAVGEEAVPVGEPSAVDDDEPPPRWRLIPKPRLSDVRRPCPNPCGLSASVDGTEGPLTGCVDAGAGSDGRRTGWGGSDCVGWFGDDGRRLSELRGKGGREDECAVGVVAVVVEGEDALCAGEGSEGLAVGGRGLAGETSNRGTTGGIGPTHFNQLLPAGSPSSNRQRPEIREAQQGRSQSEHV